MGLVPSQASTCSTAGALHHEFMVFPDHISWDLGRGLWFGRLLSPHPDSPPAPTQSELSIASNSPRFTGIFKRDLKNSDALHWGGRASVHWHQHHRPARRVVAWSRLQAVPVANVCGNRGRLQTAQILNGSGGRYQNIQKFCNQPARIHRPIPLQSHCGLVRIFQRLHHRCIVPMTALWHRSTELRDQGRWTANPGRLRDSGRAPHARPHGLAPRTTASHPPGVQCPCACAATTRPT
jgi:hypothetical protein